MASAALAARQASTVRFIDFLPRFLIAA
jgi:hypothetical protein